jgi:hypothetical protein
MNARDRRIRVPAYLDRTAKAFNASLEFKDALRAAYEEALDAGMSPESGLQTVLDWLTTELKRTPDAPQTAN